MRVLLDECLPKRLKRDLTGHQARTAPEMGWASKRNGDLLRLAERDFDVFLTVDRKLQHQQNLSMFNRSRRAGCAEQHARGFAAADADRFGESLGRKTQRGARFRRRRKSTDK